MRRKVSACAASRAANDCSMVVILVSARTSPVMCSPNCSLSSASVAIVSSSRSWSRPVAIATSSRRISQRMRATSSGCTR